MALMNCPNCNILRPFQIAISIAGLVVSLHAPAADEAFIEASKDKVREMLKDPESAQFSNIYVTQNGGSPSVCGFVNAKNSYGGYVGKIRFVASPDIATIWANTKSDISHGIIETICGP